LKRFYINYPLMGLLILSLWQCTVENQAEQNPNDWPSYLGGPSTNQFSALDQITTDNVHQLELAWTYDSGGADTINNRSQIQCNPLIIDGILYGTSADLQLFALDAATGEELWKFNPFSEAYDLFGMGVNRGVTYWENDDDKRILYTASSFLYAVNAETGEPISTFGENGRVDLHNGLDREGVEDLFIVSNTPGIIYEDLIIMGSRVMESVGAAPGHIRAFDVRTGEVAWTFHTIPYPGEFGYETWPKDAWQNSGGANAWAGMSVDDERGMVFIPTGSASFDFYGGDRHGKNLFANCILALDAATGERIWHYQTVHHDLWDRDLPCPPNLVTVEHDGEKIDAVAQVTKSAYVFLLNRDTGEPLFPVEEVPVPASKLKGEEAWPTQPIPTKPKPFARHTLTDADLTRRTPEAYAFAKEAFENSLPPKPFTPMSEEGTFVFPGFDGGGEWGGAAVDEDGILYINASEMAWLVHMEPVELATDNFLASQGKMLFQQSCVTCHGKNLEGGSVFGNVPSLQNLKEKFDAPQVAKVIKQGQGTMPAFAHLEEEEVEAITAYLLESQEKIEATAATSKKDWIYPYAFGGYNRFKDPDGFPAITPPWGTLNAINLNTGDIEWKVPFGKHPGIEDESQQPTGTESYGGPVVTAGNVLFIAASLDETFRAYDKRTGALLWETDLPAAGYATPATYSVNGKQYVVIAAGGGKLGTKSGDQYLAFALPE